MNQINCKHWTEDKAVGKCGLTGNTISLGYCQNVCKVSEKKDPSKPILIQVTVKKGLGDMLEKAIDVVTAGQGKKIAETVAKAAGQKGCGCGARKAALNKIGEKIGIGVEKKAA